MCSSDLTFPDRLIYSRKSKSKDGRIEFKTDNRDLFVFSLEEAAESKWILEGHTFDLHHDEEMCRGNIMTEYEEKFAQKGNPIHKMIIRR